MTENEYYFLQLGEECAEVQHRISKLLRFGPDEIQDGNTIETNSERLRYEIYDMLSVLEILEEKSLIQHLNQADRQLHSDRKREKIERYLQYSKDLGIVK